MKKTKKIEKVIEYSNKWREIIHTHDFPEKSLGKWIIKESVDNFKHHINQGLLDNRKSILEGGEWAVTEWKGEGSIFYDVLGRRYIDFLGGYGLMSLGWSPPEVIEGVQAQLKCNSMPSQELIDPLRGALGKIMADILPGDIEYSFFVASGTEAIEGAIKLAKMYTKKSAFIVAINGFHGKTMGSLSMMGKSLYREPVGLLYAGEVFHIPFGDADALEQQLETCKKIGIGVAGVLFEPIQGEAGAIVPPDDFWPRARELTKKYGTLLIADEVQTGLGRTGSLWGVDNWGVSPDIIACGKALGGGVMPVSCFSSTKEIWQCMMYPNPNIHTNTTGGNALACAAAITTINIILRDNLAEQAQEKGEYILKKVRKYAEKYPELYEKVTGKGLLIGQHFLTPEIGYRVSAECFKRGLLLGGTLNSTKTIRIEPPLVITYDEINEGLGILEEALKITAKEMGK